MMGLDITDLSAYLTAASAAATYQPKTLTVGVDGSVLFRKSDDTIDGSANLLYDPVLQTLSLGGTEDDPPVIAAIGADTDVSLKLASKGDGFLQLGPDTYGISGWAGYNVDIEMYRTSNTEPNYYGHYMEVELSDIADTFAHGLFILVTSAGVGATQDIVKVSGVSGTARSRLPTGLTAGLVEGLNFQALASGGGTVTDAYGVFTQVETSGGSTINNGYGITAYLYNLSPNNDTSKGYAFYGQLKNDAKTMNEVYGLWLNDFGSRATHPYYVWFDSRGVYRIREDNVADGSGNPQAIPALYNPRFTKYTPGAADFERSVEQWVNNVLQLGAEAGGTGTLRALKLLAASVSTDGVFKAGGYQSSDGSAGITGGPFTSVTVKNGLVVAGS